MYNIFSFRYERKIFINKSDFVYKLKTAFSEDINDHFFTLKCIPCHNQRQKVEEISIKINDGENFTKDIDSFGNIVINGSIMLPHKDFSVEVKGTVITDSDVFENYDEDSLQSGIFKYHTALTNPGCYIKEYSNSLQINTDNPYNFSLELMHKLNNDISYLKGSTDITTKAEDAMKNKKGVCQDYAHIMISLLRIRNIPAKYCVGMLSGEGETHAWVEVLSNNRWYGFDPTNNLLVDKNYIKISSGRDATDCSVNKGIFKGNALQQQKASVLVTQRNI